MSWAPAYSQIKIMWTVMEEAAPLVATPPTHTRTHTMLRSVFTHPSHSVPGHILSVFLHTPVICSPLLTEGTGIASRYHHTCSTPNTHGGYFLQALPGLLQLPPGETEAVHRGGLQERGQVTCCCHHGVPTNLLTSTVSRQSSTTPNPHQTGCYLLPCLSYGHSSTSGEILGTRRTSQSFILNSKDITGRA